MDVLRLTIRDYTRARFIDDPKEERRLFRAAQSGDLAARNRILESWLPLAVNRAQRWRKSLPQVPLEDLIQHAVLALMRSIDKFKLRRKVKFSTYAVAAINFAFMTLRAHDRLIRISASMPTVEMVPCMERTNPISLFCLGTEDSELLEMLTDTSGPLEADGLSIQDRERYQQVAKALAKLEPRERFVVEQVLAEKLTFKEIGKAMGSSKQRAQQLWTSAIVKLQRKFGVENLEKRANTRSYRRRVRSSA